MINGLLRPFVERSVCILVFTIFLSILCQMLSIAEFRGVPFATFKAKTLTLKTRILQSVVPGIARLLQNSPGLKKITIYTIKRSTEVVYLYHEPLLSFFLHYKLQTIQKKHVLPFLWLIQKKWFLVFKMKSFSVFAGYMC